MAIQYNGVLIKKIYYNGIGISKVVYNGVEVFTEATGTIPLAPSITITELWEEEGDRFTGKAKIVLKNNCNYIATLYYGYKWDSNPTTIPYSITLGSLASTQIIITNTDSEPRKMYVIAKTYYNGIYSDQVDKSLSIRGYGGSYPDEFNKLPVDYWDFKNHSTNELIHGLHNYPAVMIFPISRTIIDIIKKHKEIDSLLDPFAGSGTVLVEGQIAGIKKVIGNDLNPLALLIADAKTTILNEEDLADIKEFLSSTINVISDMNSKIYEFEQALKKEYDITHRNGWGDSAREICEKYISDNFNDEFAEIPNIKNIGFWFIPSVLLTISLIKYQIQQISNENIKPLVQASFSEFIRYTSNTRNSEFKLYRITAEKVKKLNFDLIKEFSNVIEKNINKMISYKKYVTSDSNVKLYSDNCMNLKSIDDESIDLVITSPPYGDSKTTVAYGQFSKLSSLWLDLIENENVDANLLGGKKFQLI